MNQRRLKFVEEYLKSGNATQAAILAGYSQKYAGNNAGKLLKSNDIVNYIKEKNRGFSSKNIADMNEIREFWTRVIRSKTDETKDKLKASELLARTYGAFLDKIQLDGAAKVQIIDDIPGGESL